MDRFIVKEIYSVKVRFSMRYYIFSIIVFFALSIGTVSSFAQVTEPLVTVSVDKPSYVVEDTIVISGAVKSIVEQTPLTYQIFDPVRNQVQIGQVDVAQDGKFTTTLKPGKLWKLDGTYTVKVQYGPPNVVAETNFEFRGTISPITKMFEVDAGNQGTFDVEYTINDGTVKDMIIDFESLALVISINATSDGTITVNIPRVLMDAKTTSGEDDVFIILIDGAEVTYNEEKTTSSRTLTIQFLEGDSDIEIIGTQIVPEFGPIAALVLAVAIISIIAVSAKTRLRLIPKF